MTQQESPVLLERGKGTATVTINRAERRNALDRETKVRLRDALAEVAEDSSVRAVLLTGAGSAFCVGQDLSEHADALEENPATAFATVDEHYSPIVSSLLTMPKPVVAAVNGLCFGAGLGFALAADLRVFGRSAGLGTAFSGIGLTCDSGLSGTLVKAVGQSKASELLLVGRPFTAEDAVTWGVTGTVVDDDQVTATASTLVSRLAAGPTAAYAETKKLLADSWSLTLPQLLSAEAAAQQRLGLTGDHQTAVLSFIAKQKPVFHGN